MNKKLVITQIIVFLLITLACTISYEGINFGSDPEVDLLEDQTATAMSASTPLPQKPAATIEPEYKPVDPQSSNSESANAGSHEYSVTATNFDCICQVDGNTTANFNFIGSQLEFTNPGGGIDIYEKIDENKYKRSFMGYYILVEGSGAQATETTVEEEKHVVIILTDSGYVMEHYSGPASDPCCFHTFTIVK